MINLVQQGNCIGPVRIQRHGHDIVATGNTGQCIPTLGKHDCLTIGGQVRWARDGIIKVIVIQAGRTGRSGGIRAKIDGIKRMSGQAQASACRCRTRPIGPIAQIVFVQRYRIGVYDRIGCDGDRHIIGDINRQSLRNLLRRQPIGGILVIIRNIRNGRSRRGTGYAEGQCLNILPIGGFMIDLIQHFEGIAAIGIQGDSEDITPACRRGQDIARRIIIGDRLPSGGQTRRTGNNPVHIVILQGGRCIIRRAICTIIDGDQIATTGQAHIATGCQAFLGRVGTIGQVVFVDRTRDSRTNGILIILNLGNIIHHGDAEFLRNAHSGQIADRILVIIGRCQSSRTRLPRHPETKFRDVLARPILVIDTVQQVESETAIAIQCDRKDIAPIRRGGQRICRFVIGVGDILTLAGQINRPFNGEVHITKAKPGRRPGRRPIGTIINGDQITRIKPDAARDRTCVRLIRAIAQIIFIHCSGQFRRIRGMGHFRNRDIIGNADIEGLRNKNTINPWCRVTIAINRSGLSGRIWRPIDREGQGLRVIRIARVVINGIFQLKRIGSV